MHNQGWCSGRRGVPECRTPAGRGQPASALRRPGQPASYLLGEFLLKYQRGAQVAGAAHEQLVGAALQEGDRCADGAQSPELAEGLHVVGAAQGVVHECGHRVHARAPEQEGGAGVGVRLAPLFGAGARVDEALGGAQVALAGPGEKRALRDVVEHVGHPGHAAVQTTLAAVARRCRPSILSAAPQRGQLLEDAFDGGGDQGRHRLLALASQQAALVVIEAVGETALGVHAVACGPPMSSWGPLEGAPCSPAQHLLLSEMLGWLWMRWGGMKQGG